MDQIRNAEVTCSSLPAGTLSIPLHAEMQEMSSKVLKCISDEYDDNFTGAVRESADIALGIALAKLHSVDSWTNMFKLFHIASSAAAALSEWNAVEVNEGDYAAGIPKFADLLRKRKVFQDSKSAYDAQRLSVGNLENVSSSMLSFADWVLSVDL